MREKYITIKVFFVIVILFFLGFNIYTIQASDSIDENLTIDNGYFRFTGDSDLSLTATSGVLNLSGLLASTINTGSNTLTITSGNFNVSSSGTVTVPAGQSYSGLGALILSSATTTALTITSGTTGAINIGTDANAKTITIGNATGTTGLVLNTGSAGVQIGNGANYVGITSSGDLTLNGTSRYLVDADEYAFQYSDAPNYGLVFSGTNSAYEFQDGAGNPLFSFGASGGVLGNLIVGNSTTSGSLLLSDGSANSVTINTPAVSVDYSLTLPVDDGTNGQVLLTDGNGALSWTAGLPAGTVTSAIMRYNGTNWVEETGLLVGSTGFLDINLAGESIEIGDGTAADSYINFDDGTNRNFGWDDSEGNFSTFGQDIESVCGPSTTFSYERGTVSSNASWAVGNGRTTQGIVAGCDGVVKQIAAQCINTGTSLSAILRKNGVVTTCTVSISTTSNTASISSCNESFVSTDLLAIYAGTEVGTWSECVGTIWIKYD